MLDCRIGRRPIHCIVATGQPRSALLRRQIGGVPRHLYQNWRELRIVCALSFSTIAPAAKGEPAILIPFKNETPFDDTLPMKLDIVSPSWDEFGSFNVVVNLTEEEKFCSFMLNTPVFSDLIELISYWENFSAAEIFLT